MTKAVRALHPDWACCDPTQDLAGWLVASRARIAVWWRWNRALHIRGRRLGAESIKATIAGDRALADRLTAASRAAHGNANAYGQRALIRDGHLERVERAHQFRLASGPAGGLP